VQPLVSVLTPSYNQGRWLADNLNSVALQTYPHVEQIVMDGGSTDRSVEILRSAGRRVRWRSERDRGQSHALNKALADSRGEIIGWLNSDDTYWDDRVVADVVRYFQKHPKVDVVYGHAAFVNASGLVLHMMWVPPFSLHLLRLHNFISQPAAFIRRSAVGDFMVDESFDYAMDQELWLRLAQAHRFGRIGRVLAIDRHHLTRKSLTRHDLLAIDAVRLTSRYGATPLRRSRTQLKAAKVAFRLLGLGLVPAAFRPLAFGGIVDSRWGLAFRQIMLPRSRMPAEGVRADGAAVPAESIVSPSLRGRR
jgi:glycosyltransferase involved in cell wall biosynthesis